MDDVIKVYGATWCPDCRRAKRFLLDQRSAFEWHDIEVDPDGVRIVQERNGGNNTIPTIVFPTAPTSPSPRTRSSLTSSGSSARRCCTCTTWWSWEAREVVVFRAKDGVSGKLGAIELRNTRTGEREELHAAACFVFIGLDPNTDFVRGQVDLDERGLVLTDMAFQTSMPGVFAAGDVRAGSTKQLASAVGEGAAAAIAIRPYLDAQEAKPVHAR